MTPQSRLRSASVRLEAFKRASTLRDEAQAYRLAAAAAAELGNTANADQLASIAAKCESSCRWLLREALRPWRAA